MTTLPRPRSNAEQPLSKAEELELGRVMIDLTDAVMHGDNNRAADLIASLDPQEAADALIGLAFGNARYLTVVAGGHPAACAQLRATRQALEDGKLLG